MLRARTKGIAVLTVFGISLIVGSLLLNLSITPVDLTEADHTSMNNIQDSSTNVIMKNNPFYNHTNKDLTMYADSDLKYLYEHDDGITLTALFHHSYNNTQDFSLIDDNFYTVDQFYYMMGLGQILYPPLTKLLRWNSLKDTPLWDKSTEEGGFFSGLYDNLTALSDEKLSFDNLLPILFLLEGFIKSEYDNSIKSNISAQWDTATNLFWDTTNNGFAHSNLDSEIKYTTDNLLAAYIAFKLASEPKMDYIRTDTLNKGQEIMDIFN